MKDEGPLILCTVPPRADGKLQPYIDAITTSGGQVIHVPATDPLAHLEELLASVDGVLIPGGTDVNAALYGQANKDYTDTPDDPRDDLETRVLAQVIGQGVPTLAICRGLQILNVYCGGDLYQDVAKEMPKSLRHDWHKDDQGKDLPRSNIVHQVQLKPESLLAEIIGVDTIGVNSLHHQGIRTLGKGLLVSAVAEDGLIEGVELLGHPFLIGVQWHPEALYAQPAWRNLFDSFITSCFLSKTERSAKINHGS